MRKGFKQLGTQYKKNKDAGYYNGQLWAAEQIWKTKKNGPRDQSKWWWHLIIISVSGSVCVSADGSWIADVDGMWLAWLVCCTVKIPRFLWIFPSWSWRKPTADSGNSIAHYYQKGFFFLQLGRSSSCFTCTFFILWNEPPPPPPPDPKDAIQEILKKISRAREQQTTWKNSDWKKHHRVNKDLGRIPGWERRYPWKLRIWNRYTKEFTTIWEEFRADEGVKHGILEEGWGRGIWSSRSCEKFRAGNGKYPGKLMGCEQVYKRPT